MPRYKLLILNLIIVLLITPIKTVLAAGPALPIPAQVDFVVWSRGRQMALDPQLKSSIVGNRVVDRYLEMLSLTVEQIDYAVLFTPFDKNLILRGETIDRLPAEGGLIISTNSDLEEKLRNLRARGWKLVEYSNKKLLWWSTGEKYYKEALSGECVAVLPGGALALAGSEAFMKNILDVSGNKQQGLASTGAYQMINDEFFSNELTAAGIFVGVTDDLRSMIKADTIFSNSPTVKAAIEYIDHLTEGGVSAIGGGNDYHLKGYAMMDSDNNALVVSSLLQIGGGLANLLPKSDPNRSTLADMSVTRNARIVKINTNFSKQQLLNLLKR
jgi:hypothetical protein